MNNTHYISSENLDLPIIHEIIENRKKIALSEESILNIKKSRTYLDQKINNSNTPFYGINTGFGSLCNVAIDDKDLTQLQENLVRSHACGIGDLVPKSIVKLMLFLKIQSLSYGHSGVTIETVNFLVSMYNLELLPVVYTQGSLGASGDLAPLAHLALPLLGEGKFWDGSAHVDASVLLKKHNLNPLKLKAKEGLALLNGTQFMGAYGIYCLLKIHKLSYLADYIGALSIDAFNCNMSPFNALVHFVRPHRGQIKTAERIRGILDGSEISAVEKDSVQDPYSFRCIPQVHGATKDAIVYATKVFKTEINSVTDNPNIFPEDDMIISGGNFHGQPLALTLDFLAIAVSELGNISERRVYQLISGQRELPSFLIKTPGLNSGFMIPQYTAASIVSQNKQFCTPASIDSIVSSNGQEDHVSMGANSATKLLKVVENVEKLLAIELFNAAQAIEFRRPFKSSEAVEMLLKAYREEVPFLEKDVLLSHHIHTSLAFIEHLHVDIEELYR